MAMDYKDPNNRMHLIKLRSQTLRRYYHYIYNQLKSNYKKAAIFILWLGKYLSYQMQEQNFRPNYNINYRRGQVILVDFGYRIGSELGGAHYAVVLDMKSSKQNNQVTVIPLRSDKGKDTRYLSIYTVNIGTEIKDILDRHHRTTANMYDKTIADVGQMCTISKMRIITPTKAKDYLAGEYLSSSAMTAIQEKIQLLFFQN